MIKSGFISIIGRPNVGKSTFLNQIIAAKIAIVTNKPQTTRNQIKGIYNDDRGQMIFIDTPGIHKEHHELGNRLNNIAWSSLKNSDQILWFIPANEIIGLYENKIKDYFHKEHANLLKKLIVIITKSDTLTKDALVKKEEEIKEFVQHNNVTTISALTNFNLETLKSQLFDNLPEAPLYYPIDEITDVNNKFITQEIIRETIIEKTREEIHYSIAVIIEKFDNKDNYLFIEAKIIVDKDSQKGILIGKGGKAIKDIGIDARKKITDFFEKKVTLKLLVKVIKNWRNDKSKLNQLGY